MSYYFKRGISSAFKCGFIKMQDVRLLKEFSDRYKPYSVSPKVNSVLFYPSSGTDFITPILLGLPFCREFYFYEHEPLGQSNRNRQSTMIEYKRILIKIAYEFKKINGFNMHRRDWIIKTDDAFIKFNYDEIERTIHWVHKDNKDFLKKDVNLTFYFHRGDSYGEGGSGQFWDSDLLPELVKKVKNDYGCLFVTDGEPRGLLLSVKEKAYVFKINKNTGGCYYYGILPSHLQYSCIHN